MSVFESKLKRVEQKTRLTLTGAFGLVLLRLTMVVSIRDASKGCWPYNVVPYRIEQGFSKEQKLFILYQIRELHRMTCVRWVDMRENNLTVPDFARFVKSSEGRCYEVGGRWSKGFVATIMLSDLCFERKRTVIHEMLHAMGFPHEHQRPDRDCYVNVDETIVQESGKAIQFEIFPLEEWLVSFPYDKRSVMHYSRDFRMKAHSEIGTVESYEYEPLGSTDGKLTNIDLWKILYRFCDAPHYCEVAPLVCEMIDTMEKDCRKPSIEPD